MKRILVVIDMQNDFITGSLGTGEAARIMDPVIEKLNRARREGREILFTQDTHADNYLETAEGRHLPVKHCIRGTVGWELADGLRLPGEKAFEKPTFGSMELAEYLRASEAEEIEFIGVCTDICVISNVLLAKACLPEARISVDASCCAGVTPQSHQTALAAMKMCQIEISGESDFSERNKR